MGHPRYTHALVNLPLLFGPLVWPLYSRLARWCASQLSVLRSSAASTSSTPLRPSRIAAGPVSPLARRRRRQGAGGESAHARARSLLIATIVSGVVLLSIAPHQEARFLLPLLTPFALLSGVWVRTSGLRWTLWLAFNALLAVLFGGVHQAGLVRAVSYLHK